MKLSILASIFLFQPVSHTQIICPDTLSVTALQKQKIHKLLSRSIFKPSHLITTEHQDSTKNYSVMTNAEQRNSSFHRDISYNTLKRILNEYVTAVTHDMMPFILLD